MIGRRTFLEITGGAAVAAVVAACRASSGLHNEAARLRVMLNGGIYEELARRLVIDPFEKETGGRVDVVPASSAQIITRVLAERAAPSVDVVVVDQLVMGKAIDEGVFERVEPGNVPPARRRTDYRWRTSRDRVRRTRTRTSTRRCSLDCRIAVERTVVLEWRARERLSVTVVVHAPLVEVP